jgi:hypothetical protein
MSGAEELVRWSSQFPLGDNLDVYLSLRSKRQCVPTHVTTVGCLRENTANAPHIPTISTDSCTGPQSKAPSRKSPCIALINDCCLTQLRRVGALQAITVGATSSGRAKRCSSTVAPRRSAFPAREAAYYPVLSPVTKFTAVVYSMAPEAFPQIIVQPQCLSLCSVEAHSAFPRNPRRR